MALFGRSKRSTADAPGQPRDVIVSAEQGQSIAERYAKQAVARAAQPLPRVADSSLAATYTQVLHRGAAASDDDARAGRCWQAARLGWAMRQVEFEGIGDEPHHQPLASLMVHAKRERSFGDDWPATMMGAAALLWNASRQTPYAPDAAQMLGPVGIGVDLRHAVTRMLVLCIDPASQPYPPEELADLTQAVRFGYWYRACFASLPDMVRDMVFTAS